MGCKFIIAPSDAPSVVPSTAPTTTPDVTQTPEENTTPAKVTTSGNKIKLVDSNGTVYKTATFDKKKATLSSDGVKVKSVKAAGYTKKGTLVYLKKNGKAYYLTGKKSKLIAKMFLLLRRTAKGLP